MYRIKMFIGALALIAVAGVGSFFYLTRDIAAPTENVQASVAQIDTSEATGSEAVFRNSQADSQAEYNISEVLNGSDKLVVGTTNQVAGDLLLNLSNPSASEIGAISINARTFATDSDRRDNAVARFILRSEDAANEFITFEPTSTSGLPESLNVGDTASFQVTGNLTVSGISGEVTFDVAATLASEGQLTGHAETTIERSTFAV
jgi:polyisoprenoid-binding protein YceI